MACSASWLLGVRKEETPDNQITACPGKLEVIQGRSGVLLLFIMLLCIRCLSLDVGVAAL